MQVNYPTRNRPLVKTTIVVITCTTKLTVQYWDALSPCPNKGKEIHMCVSENVQFTEYTDLLVKFGLSG